MEEKTFNRLYRQYLYYFMIGAISFVCLVFLPMIGSDLSVGLDLPKNTMGWVIFIFTKLCVAIINMLIFYSFMEQAKLNVRDNEDYKKANEILKNVKAARVKKPLAPNEWTRKQYMGKGISLFVMSLLAVFAISQAVLTFDYIVLISYLFTIGFAIVFGILQMKKAEIYWTNEYYQYALDFSEEKEKEEAAKKLAINELKEELKSANNELITTQIKQSVAEN